MLRIGNVDFPNHAFTSSGVRGIAGEGYPHHRVFPWTLADFTGANLVTKTVTLKARDGNLPLKPDGMTPKEIFPKCIIPYPKTGDVLNAVSLSNKGIAWYLASMQRMTRPFVLSFMSTSATLELRLAEWREFLIVVQTQKPNFAAPFVIELNVSCPNTGHDTNDLAQEVEEFLSVSKLQTPIIVNINLMVSPETAARISQHEKCSAISQSNSIPYGQFPDKIDWNARFKSAESPLVKRGFGPGGYSGPLALPILKDWLIAARYKIKKPLIAGGGIQSVEDADQVMRLGYPSLMGVKIGVVAIVRPWRVPSIIRHVNAYYANRWRTDPWK